MPTIRDYLETALAEAPDKSALRFKRSGRWQSWSFRDLARRAAWTGRIALEEARLCPARHIAALVAENGPEWTATYLGLAACGIAVAPVDPKLGESETAHVLRDSQARAVFLGANQLPKFVEIVEDLPDLREVFVLPPDSPGLPVSTKGGPRWHRLSYPDPTEDVEFPDHRPMGTDIASLIYTSGTTGLPKGAMLSHANFSADVEAALEILEVHDDDDFLVVLPLHHAFGFLGNLMIPLATRSRATYVESLKTVAGNLRECSPTVLLAVPLLVEKLYRRIQQGIQASLAGRTLDFLGITRPLKARTATALGGRLRFMICGGAPCPREVLVGLRRLGVPVMEGYGLTETAPVVSLASLKESRPGSVGRPLPGVEVRLKAPNEEGIGEITVRGPIVMQGYYRQPEATAAVFEEGWFRTGDLGRIAADGHLEITGRKKNVIVNREGKNIYPEEVESWINAHAFVLESMVGGVQDEGGVGERVGAVVVPDFERIAEERGPDAVRDPEALERLLRESVRSACRSLSEYKRPRRIRVRSEPFEKTPTLKIKRYLYQ